MGLGTNTNADVDVDDVGGVGRVVGCGGKCLGSVSCSICLEVVGDNGDRSWTKLQCGHQFRMGLVVSPCCVLPLTEENVEMVLEHVRPSLMADGGNVVLHEIDGLVVILKLQGVCGSCPSSTMTLKMEIETRLQDKIPEIIAVEQILDTETGLQLNEENIEKVLDEIRPYLAGTGGGELEFIRINDYVVKVHKL